MTGSKGNVDIIESLGDHIQKHIGDIAVVFHEKTSTDVHVDVYHVAPSATRPYHTLVTCGMSEKPMNVPDEVRGEGLAELMICLPESWPVDMSAFEQEENYWPVRLLKALARYPHENKTWLYAGHSVRSSNPPRPFAPNTRMTSVYIRYPVLIPREACILEYGNKSTHLWAVTPIYPQELDFKNTNGFAAFEQLLAENGITELLDPARINVALEN